MKDGVAVNRKRVRVCVCGGDSWSSYEGGHGGEGFGFRVALIPLTADVASDGVRNIKGTFVGGKLYPRSVGGIACCLRRGELPHSRRGGHTEEREGKKD